MSKINRKTASLKLNNPITSYFAKKFPSLMFRPITTPHRKQSEARYGNFKVITLPFFKDNYSYILIDLQSKVAVAIDPGEVEKILEVVGDENVKLHAVLTTHHHKDHVKANKALYENDPNIKVFGGDMRIPYLTDIVEHDSIFNVGRITVECINTPCHTLSHICYYIKGQRRMPGIVFTGDSIFVGGCGKYHEGKSLAMLETFERLSSLPGPTLIFCGHEYTITNLKFAKMVEPDNEEIAHKLDWALMKKDEMEPTVPSTIDEEKKINPFMRIDQDDVKLFTKTSERLDTMDRLRKQNKKFSKA